MFWIYPAISHVWVSILNVCWSNKSHEDLPILSLFSFPYSNIQCECFQDTSNYLTHDNKGIYSLPIGNSSASFLPTMIKLWAFGDCVAIWVYFASFFRNCECNKSFNFILISECNFTTALKWSLKNPQGGVTLPFTTQIPNWKFRYFPVYELYTY